MMNPNRQQRRQLEKDNAKYPEHLVEVPAEEWDHLKAQQPNRMRVWRSRSFLVQAFYESNTMLRLSINRTSMGNNGRWEENITWDDLQRLKRETGYGNHDAAEVYPRDSNVVNVANMRHLWVWLDGSMDFGWKK